MQTSLAYVSAPPKADASRSREPTKMDRRSG